MTAVAAAAIAQGYSGEEVANWQKQWEQWHQWHAEYAAQADASGAPYVRTEDGDFDSEEQSGMPASSLVRPPFASVKRVAGTISH